MIEGLHNATISLYPQSGAPAPDGTEAFSACAGAYSCYFDEDGKAARSLGNVGDLEGVDGYALVEQVVHVRTGDRVHVAYNCIRHADGSLDTSFDFDGLVTGFTRVTTELASLTIIAVKRC